MARIKRKKYQNGGPIQPPYTHPLDYRRTSLDNYLNRGILPLNPAQYPHQDTRQMGTYPYFGGYRYSYFDTNTATPFGADAYTEDFTRRTFPVNIPTDATPTRQIAPNQPTSVNTGSRVRSTRANQTTQTRPRAEALSPIETVGVQPNQPTREKFEALSPYYDDGTEIIPMKGVDIENPDLTESLTEDLSGFMQRDEFKTEPNIRGSFTDYLASGAPMDMDMDIETALFNVGQSLGFRGRSIDNPEARRVARSGNLLRGIGSAGKAILGAGRLIGSGMGVSSRYDEALASYNERLRRDIMTANTQNLAARKDGGKYQDGGSTGDSLTSYYKSEYSPEELNRLHEAAIIARRNFNNRDEFLSGIDQDLQPYVSDFLDSRDQGENLYDHIGAIFRARGGGNDLGAMTDQVFSQVGSTGKSMVNDLFGTSFENGGSTGDPLTSYYKSSYSPDELNKLHQSAIIARRNFNNREDFLNGIDSELQPYVSEFLNYKDQGENMNDHIYAIYRARGGGNDLGAVTDQVLSQAGSTGKSMVNDLLGTSFEDGGKYKRGENIQASKNPELMTGYLNPGMDDLTASQVSAPELEKNEIIKTPENDIQKIVGDTHENGGVNVPLESGTKILSDNLKVGGSLAKMIRKKYDIKVKASDTYASIMNKLNSKIGFTKLDKEEAGIYKELEKLNQDDENTYNINKEFLTKKVKEVKDKKVPLEVQQNELFDELYKAQEMSKPKEKRDEEFRNGGEVMQDPSFVALASRYGMTPEQAYSYIQRQEQDKKKGGDYQNGGPIDPPFNFRDVNVFRDPELYVHQQFTNTDGFRSGQVTDDSELNRIKETLRIFPRAEQFLTGVERDEQGNVTAAQFKNSESVGQFQNYVQGVYDNLIEYGAEQNLGDEFYTYVSGLRFSNDEVAKNFDGILGNFSSSRSGVALPLVTDSELKDLQNQGINNYSQVFNNDGTVKEDVNLSPESKKRFEDLYKSKGFNFEARILPITDVRVDDTTPIKTEEQFQAKIGEAKGEIKTNSTVTPLSKDGRRNDPRRDPESDILPFERPASGSRINRLIFPDNTPVPPSPLQAHLKTSIRTEDIDPLRLTPEENIKEVGRQSQKVINELNTMPGPMRAAVLSNLNANSEDALNTAITNINTENARNQLQADRYNSQQFLIRQQEEARSQLDFERRQLTAEAKTRADVKDFFEVLRANRINRFRAQYIANVAQSVLENTQIGSTGVITNRRGTVKVPSRIIR